MIFLKMNQKVRSIEIKKIVQNVLKNVKSVTDPFQPIVKTEDGRVRDAGKEGSVSERANVLLSDERIQIKKFQPC